MRVGKFKVDNFESLIGMGPIVGNEKPILDAIGSMLNYDHCDGKKLFPQLLTIGYQLGLADDVMYFALFSISDQDSPAKLYRLFSTKVDDKVSRAYADSAIKWLISEGQENEDRTQVKNFICYRGYCRTEKLAIGSGTIGHAIDSMSGFILELDDGIVINSRDFSQDSQDSQDSGDSIKIVVLDKAFFETYSDERLVRLGLLSLFDELYDLSDQALVAMRVVSSLWPLRAGRIPRMYAGYGQLSEQTVQAICSEGGLWSLIQQDMRKIRVAQEFSAMKKYVTVFLQGHRMIDKAKGEVKVKSAEGHEEDGNNQDLPFSVELPVHLYMEIFKKAVTPNFHSVDDFQKISNALSEGMRDTKKRVGFFPISKKTDQGGVSEDQHQAACGHR